METSAKQENTLQALGIVSQNSSRVEGVANSILEFLASKTTFLDSSEMRTSLRSGLITEIYQGNTDDEKIDASLIPLTPQRRQRLQKLVLSTLRYSGMGDREGRIAETYESTFKWVFRDKSGTQEWCSLRRWLEGESQIYWVTGKPGSGKSTLMKYICQPVVQEPGSGSSEAELDLTARQPERRCQPYLKKWAGSKKLLVASFYFWDAGVQLQLAQTGLIRSLLYQILQERPELIPIIAPSRWESLALLDFNPETWKDSELELALTTAVKAVKTDCRLCFFIDGLDEFDGAHDSLITLVKSLAHQNTNVKFCVASRPWVVFEDAFETKPHLRIETLTYNDIKHYVSSNFYLNPEFSKLQTRQPEFADQLVENIVSKASGVFLWVNLVVASLLAGMSYGDRIADLQQRLDLLPPDLEELYDKMLRSLDPFYLEHAAQLLMIMEATKDPLSLILFSFADDQTVDSVIRTPAGPLSISVMSLHLDAMTRRLNSRWKGLLEIDRAVEASNPRQRAHQTVQYLHRTVKDFIKSKKVEDFLKSSLKSPFDPHLSLCIAQYAYIKSLPVSATPAEEKYIANQVRSCLFYAARALPVNEKDIVKLLDHMASTLPTMYATKKSKPASTSRHMNQNSPRGPSQPEPCPYLGIKWDHETRQASFGETFLSLAVIHGVTAYVKARAQNGCLVQKPCYRGTSLIWPLLMDAVCTGVFRIEMIECLLSMGADPNYSVSDGVESTPWLALLQSIQNTLNRRVHSLCELPKDCQVVVEAMVVNGADLDSAWSFYVPKFTNRFGSRIQVENAGVAFSEGFFGDLKNLPVKRKRQERHSKKWFKIWV